MFVEDKLSQSDVVQQSLTTLGGESEILGGDPPAANSPIE